MTIPNSRTALLLGAAIALLACGQQPAANADTNAGTAEITSTATANEAGVPEPQNAASPTQDPGAFSKDYMVGKWSALNEDCSGTLEFRKDGTVTTPIGTAKWTIAADKLSIDYSDESAPTVSTVKVLGPDRIELTHASGTKETERRC
jgi:hypothetical protein